MTAAAHSQAEAAILLDMNLVYDISALGAWFEDMGGKRGIYRVVEELFDELSKEPGMRISATANSEAAARYLATRQPAATPPFDRSPTHDLASRAAYRFGKFAETNRRDRLSNRTITRRMSRYASEKLAIGLPALAARIPSVDLARTDVFHQPGRLPFPPYLRNYRRKGFVRFHTIYDFIPFEREWQKPQDLSLLRSVFGSLSPGDFAICISEHVRRQACDILKLRPENVFVAPLAAAPGIFYPCADPAALAAVRKQLHLGDSPYFLSLSSLDPRKNMDFLITTFAEMTRNTPGMEANLVLAGSVSPDVRSRLEDSAKRLGIGGRVILTGYVPDGLLAALYSGGLAFVFPSLAEGFGLPPLEAMQCGLPVICSNRSSLPEVVGEAGILFDPADPGELAGAMQRMLREPETRERYAGLGLARASEFTWRRCADDHLRAYTQALQMSS